MRTVILKTDGDRLLYVNPNMVESIEEDGPECCLLWMANGGGAHTITLSAHLVASILDAKPEREDKFVSYKDWEYNDE